MKNYNSKTCIPASFFAGDTVEVAQNLLGKVLVRRWQDGTSRAFSIVEVEAYTQEDPACHAFNGPTKRSQVMFEDPGYSYVYFIYGMYHCLNVVTEAPGRGCAVLIRGLDGLGSIDLSGPGKLCKNLDIDLTYNRLPLFKNSSPISLHHALNTVGDVKNEESEIIATPRIGISKGKEHPWRFTYKTKQSRDK